MNKLNVAPTKSNLLAVKEQLEIAQNGYELLEQKREILAMELVKVVRQVKDIENKIEAQINVAYPALKEMLVTVGLDRSENLGQGVSYDFKFVEKKVQEAGMSFLSFSVEMPDTELFCSSLDTFAESDNVTNEFLKLLSLLTNLASIKTIALRLADEIKKTCRRVNALEKMVIPETDETKRYIESILEERERENVFVLKTLKTRQNL